MSESSNILLICGWVAGAAALVLVIVARAILAYERQLARLVRDLDAEIEGENEPK